MKTNSASVGSHRSPAPPRPAPAARPTDPTREVGTPPRRRPRAAPAAEPIALEEEGHRRALRPADDGLRAILERSGDAIVVIDPVSLDVLALNSRASRLLGYRCEQGRTSARRVLHADEMPAMSRFIRAVLEQGTGSSTDLSFRTASGRAVPLEISASRFDLDGRPHLLATLRDRDGGHPRLRPLCSVPAPPAEGAESDAATIIGESPVMQSLFEAVAQVAESDATVLLVGETGTGKELIAQAIHARSWRRDGRLVKLNCAALPSELVESELFGHEKGAFTGALSLHKGRFETADGGTLFLDEVGDLAAPAQAKLLRVIEQCEFERVGGTRSIQADVRIIAATNRDLEKMVREGTFRLDLYYRLNVFPILVPPLRERRSDIALLAHFFADRFARKMGKTVTAIAPRSLERLTEHSWPGNVRELQNVIERAVILARSGILDVEPVLRQRDGRLAQRCGAPPSEVCGTLAAMERAYIRQALEEHGWVIEGPRGAAALLGLKPSTLRSRMHKLDIRR